MQKRERKRKGKKEGRKEGRKERMEGKGRHILERKKNTVFSDDMKCIHRKFLEICRKVLKLNVDLSKVIGYKVNK